VTTASGSNVVQGLTLDGVLSGSGFVKTGSGSLVLGDAGNTFTGNININQGVVSIDNDSQLGNAANLVLLNPQTGTATLRATESFTLTHAIQLSNTSNIRAIEVIVARPCSSTRPLTSMQGRVPQRTCSRPIWARSF